MDFEYKYRKYKYKYLTLKNNLTGGAPKNTYLIHDNGGRPFKVEIVNNKTVKIYKQMDDASYDKKPIQIFKTDKLFIGKSPKNEMTEFSAGHGPKFDGNTILLRATNNEYIFIGSEIFKFKTHAPIMEYTSPVGNNDVPYPHAVDEAGNYYLLVENIILQHDDKMMDKMQTYDDPYLYYYDNISRKRKKPDHIKPLKRKILEDRDISGTFLGEYIYKVNQFKKKNKKN